MKTSLSAYPEFVEELEDFNRFSEAYFQRGERVRVRRRDPDVERLIEALAFFSAQTRIAATRNIRAEFRSLYHTYLDFLLQPLPTMGLLRAVPGPELVDGTIIPTGTEFELSPTSGRTGSFRSIAGLDLFPLARGTGHYLENERRFVLRFESLRGRRVGSPASLALFIDRVDPMSSIGLHDLLRAHLEAVTIRYDRSSERQPGTPCQASFGRRASQDDRVAYDAGHPLLQVRRYFHFPEERLFLNLSVPPADGAWSSFSLIFDLDRDWPRHERLAADDFHLHVVPVENLHRAFAAPIAHEGLSSSYPIVHPEPKRGFVQHSLIGVYENTPNGQEPICSRLLPSGGSSYGLEAVHGGRQDGPQLISLDIADAFEKPRRVAVEALWHQPDFVAANPDSVTVAAPGRAAGRVRWELAGALRPHASSALHTEPSGLAHLLWLKMKPVLQRTELANILRSLKSFENSVFREMMELVVELKPTAVPVAGVGGAHVCYRYCLHLNDVDTGAHPLARSFSEQVFALISAWTAEGLVELEVTCEGGQRWTLPGEGTL
jgi:type VI secretion system protein ImpG